MSVLGHADLTLAARVKALTQADHSSAESSRFITELMGGQRSTRDYALLVSQYHFIYEALDSAADTLRQQTELPMVAQLLDPKLDRRAAILKDLATLLPESDLDPLPHAVEETIKYTDRITHVASDPARLVAHHYLRYLGDLSGGLAIARLMQRHYDLPDTQLHMYTFESIPKPKIYKDRYRDILNNIGFTPQQQDDFIDEASLGFQFNKAVFDALESYSARPTTLAV